MVTSVVNGNWLQSIRLILEECKLASKVKHNNTERDRAVAERLIHESDRLDQEGRGTIERTLADINKKNLVNIDSKLDKKKHS
ncbi:unnamed protein product [Rotaria socialis]|uniref:Uncharacterized protein n=1 Tax=Rotaria socialis TaxID=392032 RepID=A0A818CXB7_9BILA|nr:unnamed protein product [Rotaria socialis]CAF3295862.1 unnamed protein product [Rotaria socialis]CAF3321988.1 unnamed protein product [Rotaria socialis]CAF3432819.1 unnamed protein product [Rotaria socialis]CAF3725091.1 unnamed protein product [Rotaria socialis]